jgi:hypothetical protein
MAESRKEKVNAQLRKMLDRWEDRDSEFRQYVAWRTENLKLLGAGNTSGILAIAVFLTTGARIGGMVIIAKLCLLVFGVGFGAFFWGYRTLYRCAGHMEDGLITLRAGAEIESKSVGGSISRAADYSERTGMLVLISTICFALASFIAFLGLLLS